MNLKRREFYKTLDFDAPSPEYEMVGKCDGRFPCHVLRQIYQMTDNEEIKLKCRIATTMVRKMSFKLSEFNINWKHLYDENNKE